MAKTQLYLINSEFDLVVFVKIEENQEITTRSESDRYYSFVLFCFKERTFRTNFPYTDLCHIYNCTVFLYLYIFTDPLVMP